MDDLISRQALCEYALNQKDKSITPNDIMRFPSAKPEPSTDDCISRKAAIDALKNERSDWNCDYNVPVDHCIDAIYSVPSAQPEHTNSCYTNSWCIDCKEYDHERKCCPRYNRVIKQTLDEVYAHAETEAEARFHDEIVRCKDCTFYRSDGCFFSTAEVGEDGFCSWGRKENR